MRATLLTYGVPFVGSVLLAVGIAGGVMGGYALFQEQTDRCGDPRISVASAEETERLAEGYTPAGGPDVARLRLDDLSPAERRAVQSGMREPETPATVEGSFPHRDAFRRGVLVVGENETRYVTLATDDRCPDVSPLLLPLGLAAGLLGVVGVLTPPLYRRYLAFERRQRRGG